MKVNIAIAEDEEFRQHVKDMISGEIRKILREELKGLVTGELARSRLLDPNSPTMNELINKRIMELVSAQLQNQLHNIPFSVRWNNEAQNRFNAVMNFIRTGAK